MENEQRCTIYKRSIKVLSNRNYMWSYDYYTLWLMFFLFNFLSFQNQPQKDQSLSSNSILLVSELPEDGFTEEDIRKAFLPFGKISDVLLVPCRNEVSHRVSCENPYRLVAFVGILLVL
jgi:hypothetical protein